MKLSIIIPAYNEVKTIVNVLKRIFALKTDLDFEVIIVDDGSKDNTWKLIKNSDFEMYS